MSWECGYRDRDHCIKLVRASGVLLVARFLAVTLFLFVSVSETLYPAPADDNYFTVAAVQFSVDEATYTTPGAFGERVEEIVAEATAVHNTDLLVFPEYINVFFVAREFLPTLRRAESLEEAIGALVRRYPEIDSLPELLESRSAAAAARALEIWRDLARKYDVAIVPGTFFIPDGAAGGAGVELRNRLIVLDDDGNAMYHQDKVFLTEEEEKLLGLDPGSLRAAEAIVIDEVEIGLTICRDTYFDAWNRELAGADIWIDLRANGQLYSREVRRRFDGALPERVEETAADAGVSATLTGEFLDLLWQGPAFAVDAEGRRVGESPSPVGDSLVVLEYDTESGAIEVIIDDLAATP